MVQIYHRITPRSMETYMRYVRIAAADCAGRKYTEVDTLSKVEKSTQGPRKYQNKKECAEKKGTSIIQK